MGISLLGARARAEGTATATDTAARAIAVFHLAAHSHPVAVRITIGLYALLVARDLAVGNLGGWTERHRYAPQVPITAAWYSALLTGMFGGASQEQPR